MSRRPVLVFVVLLSALQMRAECNARFDVPRSYADGYPMQFLDVDGDGKLDILGRAYRENGVRVMYGNGDGTFTAGELLELGEIPSHAVAADFDEDGRYDIVGGNGDVEPGVLRFFSGGANRTFGESREIGSIRFPSDLVSGDFDADGHLDLAVSNFGLEAVSLYYGRGDGTFHEPQTLLAGTAPSRLVVADLDRDGRDDLIANLAAGDIAVLRSIAEGGFEGRSYPNGVGLFSIRVTDVDGDGKLDLLTSNALSFVVTIYKGNGDATFGPRTDYRGGRYTEGADFADMNGDGRNDIVAGNSIENTFVILHGLPDGRFDDENIVEVDAGSNVFDVNVMELNGDGRPDVVASNLGGFSVVLSTDWESFEQAPSQPVGYHPEDMVTADFNADGVIDLAVTAGSGRLASVHTVRRGGWFQPAFAWKPGDWPVTIEAGDFNRDGNLDVLTVNDAIEDAQKGFAVALGKGNGFFHAPAFTPMNGRVVSSTVGDIDSDGDLDLLLGYYEDGAVRVFRGNGDGTFAVRTDLVAAERPLEVELIDVDRDGRLDLLMLEQVDWETRGRMSVHFGNGDGTFRAPVQTDVGEGPVGFAMGDIDGDGDLDVAVACLSGIEPDVYVFRAEGEGRFAPIGSYPAHQQAADVVFADLSGDGVLDLAYVDLGIVQIYRGAGDGTFVDPIAYRAGNQPNAIVAADFNSDGRTDLAILNYESSDFSVFWNRRECPRRRAVGTK